MTNIQYYFMYLFKSFVDILNCFHILQDKIKR